MGRKVGLTRAQVVAAAAAVADGQGLADVSLATVAATLGVRTPSLYAHVDGLMGLRRALAQWAGESLAAYLAAAAVGEPSPAASLRAVARAYRAFARGHPGLYAALYSTPSVATDPEWAAWTAEPIPVMMAVLTELGATTDRQVHLIHTLRAVLHGFADLEHSHGFGPTDPIDAAFETALDLVIRALTGEEEVPAGGLNSSTSNCRHSVPDPEPIEGRQLGDPPGSSR
ncbi:WHG domain-containing protein [Actinoplanes sp. KI2]|uniref:TetR/AcrR family transcriptional regulator n=1 Tax=Actinoplanes sp. KI2 TaxID=2983315 RepID=UPI0021D5CE85|nr:TetR-like C-terminal domain-containing protein [Actinoplanes sp. KI2]MCU7728835.1 WHG domain-containing protein [Actinoplanes sp. KI2]